MKPILVHIHVYYTEQWPDLYARIASFPGLDFDVWVTHCGADCCFEKQVLSDAPAAHVLQVANVGYDIAPFMEVLKLVNLENYSYCIKLHTKRDIQGDSFLDKMPFNYGGSRWRDYLVNFCAKENLIKCLHAFENQQDLGMVADYRVICRHAEMRFVEPLKHIMRRIDLPMHDHAYVMGSMFMCRAELLKPLKRCSFNPEDFPAVDAEHTENLAHVMERALGMVVAGQGYRIADVFSSRWEQSAFRRFLLHCWRFIYSSKRKKKGGRIIKIMKVPVYSSRK